MPRYKITSDTDLDEYFGFGEPKKTTAERHFGEQNIPSLGPGLNHSLRSEICRLDCVDCPLIPEKVIILFQNRDQKRIEHAL